MEFLRRVLPWPLPEQPGYCNVHWQTPDGHWGGRPFSALNDFFGYLDWAKKHPEFCKEIYFCTSLQRDAAPPLEGKKNLRAIRNKENTLALRALFLDVDVKAKGYKDVNEALDAVQKFRLDANLPGPNALVGSGGGLHIYWISDRPLTLAEWQPYANGLRALAEKHGLRCDLGVTIDCARILRVPGTYNRKTDPGRPVVLHMLSPKDTNFEKELGHIRISTPDRPVARLAARSLINLAEFPPLTPITDNTAMVGAPQSFNENLDPRPLCRDCPMFLDALMTGGKGCDQGLWMMQGLATTFLARGRETFHQLSKDYKTYTPEETDAMFDRKLAEREAKDMGWPHCETFEKYSSKQCKTCKHRGQIRSPLNLTGPVVVAPTTGGTMVDKWPDGVDHNTGLPRKGILNTIEAIKRLGITCTWDEFRQKEYWFGHADKSFDGEVSDAAVTVTRRNIRQKFRLYPSPTETRDAITDACRDNKSNPVLDYFQRSQMGWQASARQVASQILRRR